MEWKIISAKHESGEDISESQIELDMPKVGKIANKPSFDLFNHFGGVITIGDRNYQVMPK
jgi:hypothetical protein